MPNQSIDPRALLKFESKTFRYSGAKERAIGETFGVGAIRYYQALFDLLDAPPADVAVEFGPLIARKRRLLAKGLKARRTQRAA